MRAAEASAPEVSAAPAQEAGGGSRTYTQEVPFDFSGFDFNDFSEGAGAAGRRAGGGGGFRDIFSNIFGGGARGGEAVQRPEAGTDLEYQVNVDFWQAIRGAELQLSIPRLEVCGNCHGRVTSSSRDNVPNATAKARSRRRAAA